MYLGVSGFSFTLVAGLQPAQVVARTYDGTEMAPSEYAILPPSITSSLSWW